MMIIIWALNSRFIAVEINELVLAIVVTSFKEF